MNLMRNFKGNCIYHHMSYFNNFDKELWREWHLLVTGHISLDLIGNCKGNSTYTSWVIFQWIRWGIIEEIASIHHMSYLNKFDEELYRKWHLPVTGHISSNLIGNCKGNSNYISWVIFPLIRWGIMEEIASCHISLNLIGNCRGHGTYKS